MSLRLNNFNEELFGKIRPIYLQTVNTIFDARGVVSLKCLNVVSASLEKRVEYSM